MRELADATWILVRRGPAILVWPALVGGGIWLGRHALVPGIAIWSVTSAVPLLVVALCGPTAAGCACLLTARARASALREADSGMAINPWLPLLAQAGATYVVAASALLVVTALFYAHTAWRATWGRPSVVLLALALVQLFAFCAAGALVGAAIPRWWSAALASIGLGSAAFAAWLVSLHGGGNSLAVFVLPLTPWVPSPARVPRTQPFLHVVAIAAVAPVLFVGLLGLRRLPHRSGAILLAGALGVYAMVGIRDRPVVVADPVTAVICDAVGAYDVCVQPQYRPALAHVRRVAASLDRTLAGRAGPTTITQARQPGPDAISVQSFSIAGLDSTTDAALYDEVLSQLLRGIDCPSFFRSTLLVEVDGWLAAWLQGQPVPSGPAAMLDAATSAQIDGLRERFAREWGDERRGAWFVALVREASSNPCPDPRTVEA